jgi:hypothetical protein
MPSKGEKLLDVTQESQTPEVETPAREAEPSIADSVSEAVDSHFSEGEEPANPKVDNREPTIQKEAVEREADAPLDWDKLPPKAKQEYMKAQEQYKNLQSIFSKKQNEWKQTSTKASEYEKKVKLLEQWEKIYESDPELKQFINKKLGNESQIDPEIQHDPVYNYVSQYQQKMEQELAPIKAWYAEQQAQAQEKSLNERVDKETQLATDQFKDILGREPTDQEVVKLYQFMREKRLYDGASAVRAVFFDDFRGAITQKALDEQMKKKAVGTKISTIKSNSQPSQQEHGSLRDYVSNALEGMDF